MASETRSFSKKLLLSLSKVLPDATYLKMQYKRVLGRKLDLENPKRYTEKLQWLKLHDRNPHYTEMVDKLAVKHFIAQTIGEEHVIKTLACWETADDIDFSELPDKFILKCTHDSGSTIAVSNKSEADVNEIKKKLA